ncbi:hypothetical protein [Thermococcus sp.]
MEILRIKPLYIPEDQTEGLLKEIYYPIWIYVFRYHVRRMIFGDIHGEVVVLVDGINERSYIADIFPELEKIETEGKILESSITGEKSEEIARDKIETFLFRKFAYLKFSYYLKQKAFGYKLFWATKKGESYYLMDSITGDEIEIQKIKGESKQLVNNSS